MICMVLGNCSRFRLARQLVSDAVCSLQLVSDEGDYKSQFHAKAEAIAGALVKGGYELGFLHVKAVDDTGHDRALAMKVSLLQLQ